MRRILVLFFALSVPGWSQHAQQPAQPPTAKYSARVKLSVDVPKDDSLKSQLNSFLGRELRSLGDVTIVDDKPDFVIDVVVTNVLVGRSVSVISIATLVSAPLDSDILTDPHLKGAKIDDAQIEFVKSYLKTGSHILDITLHSGPVSDGQDMCKKIIVDFDSRQLDPERKLWSQCSTGRKPVVELQDGSWGIVHCPSLPGFRPR
jgi:hypothetical protein